MDQAAFFPLGDEVRISDLATLAGAELIDIRFADGVVASVAPLDRAGKGDVTFAMSRRNANALAASRATAVFCTRALAGFVPKGTAALVCAQPQAAFALAAVHLYPSAARPAGITGQAGISAQASIDSTATVEDGVTIEAFAVVGPGARIGSNTAIGPGAIIGPNVRIGRNCSIGASVCLQYALIGNDVIVHPGARIGQDGFGYVPSARGILKIVQIGRVIIQDHVEVGANTAIDRGAIDDTVIGEGTKIDNLVQIGHNVRIGRNCFIVSQVGIAGSARIGDMVMIGGAAGINGHVSVGDGAQIAAMSGVATDVPAGARWGGVPARPMRAFLRDAAEINARAFARDRDQGSDHD